MVMTQETIKRWSATQSVLQIQALFSDFFGTHIQEVSTLKHNLKVRIVKVRIRQHILTP